jgi:conjugative relaxase-like TrwC/TraI family protein
MRLSPHVLSIGKLTAGREDYYLASVADGVEEYYVGAGEARGRWRASSKSLFGLHGEVHGEELRAVLAGVDPASGAALVSGTCRKVQGFDLTFSAPKSVSLLHAFGDRDTSKAIVAAHERALDSALGWLEREACRVRRGHAGAIQHAGAGFVAAGFRHRTSRLGDPQLHTHVLVANLSLGPDGRWSALDARPLYRSLKTAGFLYEAELRAGLTRRLGVGWHPAVNGIAEIAGIPTRVLRVFSKRRRQIEAALDDRGLTSAAAARVATLATRPVKTAVDTQTLGNRWRAEADAVGFSQFEFGRFLSMARAGIRERLSLIGCLSDSSPDLSAGLTAHRSSFDRNDVLRAVAEQAQFGASVAQLEHATDQFLVSPSVVRLEDGSFSDPSLMAVEGELLTGAVARQHTHTAVVPAAVVSEAIAASEPRLSREQQRMVRHLTRDGHGVDVVVGAAGAGKTTALAAARAAWEDAGIDVVGCALAARAAKQLHDGAGIAAITIAKALQYLDDGGSLPAGGVLVVDEAAMVGTRTLHRLHQAATEAGAKLVLVGDARQLPEINAGGAFAALARTLPAVGLSENRRQRDRVERKALKDLRHGHTDRAFRRLHRHGRVVLSADPLAAMVQEWADRAGDVVMLATRRRDVASLNDAAQQHRLSRGELAGPPLQIDERSFYVGDRIVCGRNQPNLGVLNGTTAVITAIGQGGGLTIDTGQQVVALPGWYVAKHVELGYATTIHKAQGATVDHALVYADGALYAEAGYTALTRGRHTNTLYASTFETIGEHQHGRPLRRNDPLRDVIDQVRRSSAQQLAIDRGMSIAD